jgi:hypothetical protein
VAFSMVLPTMADDRYMIYRLKYLPVRFGEDNLHLPGGVERDELIPRGVRASSHRTAWEYIPCHVD